MPDNMTGYMPDGIGRRWDARVSRRSIISKGAKLAVGGVTAWALGRTVWSGVARAQVGSGPPFDFSDAFYLENGINPANILNRVNGTPPDSKIDNSNTNPNFRNVRVLNTTGGFDHAGSVLYSAIMGMVMPNTFTNDAAGQTALQIAETSAAYIFPKASGDPFSPAPSNRRQDNVFDTTTFFGTNQDPLGLWTLTFVSYTAAAFNTLAGVTTLAGLASKNGTDLDGTPLITKTSDILGLEKQGFAQLRHRAFDGSQGFSWMI